MSVFGSEGTCHVKIPSINQFGSFLRAVKQQASTYERNEHVGDTDLLEAIFKMSFTVKRSSVEEKSPTYVFPIQFSFLVNMIVLFYCCGQSDEEVGEDDGQHAPNVLYEKLIYVSETTSASKGTMWEEDPRPEYCLKKRRTLRQK